MKKAKIDLELGFAQLNVVRDTLRPRLEALGIRLDEKELFRFCSRVHNLILNLGEPVTPDVVLEVWEPTWEATQELRKREPWAADDVDRTILYEAIKFVKAAWAPDITGNRLPAAS